MLLVLATIPSPFVALVYVTVFGVGSTGGMLVLSGLLSVPFALAAGRSEAVRRAVQAFAGLGSLAVGALMIVNLSNPS